MATGGQAHPALGLVIFTEAKGGLKCCLFEPYIRAGYLGSQVITEWYAVNADGILRAMFTRMVVGMGATWLADPAGILPAAALRCQQRGTARHMQNLKYHQPPYQPLPALPRTQSHLGSKPGNLLLPLALV